MIARRACDACLAGFESKTEHCSMAAKKGDRFGDAIVRFDDSDTSKPRTVVSATPGLTKDDVACVTGEAVRLGAQCSLDCSVAGHPNLNVSVGTPRPLLPDVRELVDRWNRYRQSGWAVSRWWHHWRLARILPESVKTTPHRCLWVPSTVNLGTALALWERQLGNPLPTSDVSRVGRPQQPALDPRVAAAIQPKGWLVGEHLVLLEDPAPAIGSRLPPGEEGWQEYNDGSGIRLCLVDRTAVPGSTNHAAPTTRARHRPTPATAGVF
jgi:hypothetical protein